MASWMRTKFHITTLTLNLETMMDGLCLSLHTRSNTLSRTFSSWWSWQQNDCRSAPRHRSTPIAHLGSFSLKQAPTRREFPNEKVSVQFKVEISRHQVFLYIHQYQKWTILEWCLNFIQSCIFLSVIYYVFYTLLSRNNNYSTGMSCLT